MTERVAVVGGGVAGITAAHILQRRFEVTLLEGNDYLGGHTHTIAVPAGPDAGTPVDTGVIHDFELVISRPAEVATT